MIRENYGLSLSLSLSLSLWNETSSALFPSKFLFSFLQQIGDNKVPSNGGYRDSRNIGWHRSHRGSRTRPTAENASGISDSS